MHSYSHWGALLDIEDHSKFGQWCAWVHQPNYWGISHVIYQFFSSYLMIGVSMNSVCSKDLSVGNGDCWNLTSYFVFIPQISLNDIFDDVICIYNMIWCWRFFRNTNYFPPQWPICVWFDWMCIYFLEDFSLWYPYLCGRRRHVPCCIFLRVSDLIWILEIFGLMLDLFCKCRGSRHSPISSWKCMIPWTVIFGLRDVWHVVVFTVLCYNTNGSAS